MNGDHLLSLASDTCPVPAWLVSTCQKKGRGKDKDQSCQNISLVLQYDKIEIQVPQWLSQEGLPSTVQVQLPMLVPAPSCIDKKGVELVWGGREENAKKRKKGQAEDSNLPQDIIELLGGAAFVRSEEVVDCPKTKRGGGGGKKCTSEAARAHLLR